MNCFWKICICASIGFSLTIEAQEKPNFLVVLLDDSGWTDLECYGSRISTPNINQLAAEGMRFTDCHSAAPNCSPSRAGLLTGRIPPRAGIYSYLPENHVMHLRKEEITVAELLKENGYHTGHFGKWHLSKLESNQPGPRAQGFDYTLGTDNNAKPNHRNPINFVRNGEPVGELEGYSCEIVVDETSKWIESLQSQKTDAPFFACVWFHEPHTPIASPPDLVKKYQAKFPKLTKKQATYHANIENVDRAVGKLLRSLESMEVADDTVIFLTSDNGPLNRFSRDGLRGQKSNVWEGGHRVPGIFRWPNQIPAASESSIPISGVDYLPTICDIAGIQTPQDRAIDGTSLRSILLDGATNLERTKPLYWFFYRLNPAMAIRSGQWSLVAFSNDAERPKAHPLVNEDMRYIKDSRPLSFQLFNVSQELSQQEDVSAANPEILEKLKSQMMRLHQEVVTEGHDWEIPIDYGRSNKRRLWDSE
jgi:arylsulfatase A